MVNLRVRSFVHHATPVCAEVKQRDEQGGFFCCTLPFSFLVLIFFREEIGRRPKSKTGVFSDNGAILGGATKTCCTYPLDLPFFLPAGGHFWNLSRSTIAMALR